MGELGEWFPPLAPRRLRATRVYVWIRNHSLFEHLHTRHAPSRLFLLRLPLPLQQILLPCFL
eukprot:1442989-Amphidinium_carterae.1